MTAAEIEEFRRAAASLRGANATVQREVAKSMRGVARPVVSAVRSEVQSSKGHSQRGVHASEVERQLHVLSRSGRGGKPLTERQARSIAKRAEKMRSLRSNIAAATGASVSVNPKQVTLAFRVRARQMPPSQRKLPRRWDQENGWRHPVFGNRNVWVTQYGHPYFRKTIYSRKGEVTAGVVEALSRAADVIVHDKGTP